MHDAGLEPYEAIVVHWELYAKSTKFQANILPQLNSVTAAAVTQAQFQQIVAVVSARSA